MSKESTVRVRISEADNIELTRACAERGQTRSQALRDIPTRDLERRALIWATLHPRVGRLDRGELRRLVDYCAGGRGGDGVGEGFETLGGELAAELGGWSHPERVALELWARQAASAPADVVEIDVLWLTGSG